MPASIRQPGACRETRKSMLCGIYQHLDNTPTYGVVGTGTRSDTVYSRYLRVDLLDRATLSDGKIKKVYEAQVTSAGSKGQIAAVMPTMIKALFEDFPGKSGTTRRTILPAER